MLFGHIFFSRYPLRESWYHTTKMERGPAPAGYNGNKAAQQKLSKKTLCHLHPQASMMHFMGVKWTCPLKGQKLILISMKDQEGFSWNVILPIWPCFNLTSSAWPAAACVSLTADSCQAGKIKIKSIKWHKHNNMEHCEKYVYWFTAERHDSVTAQSILFPFLSF